MTSSKRLLSSLLIGATLLIPAISAAAETLIDSVMSLESITISLTNYKAVIDPAQSTATRKVYKVNQEGLTNSQIIVDDIGPATAHFRLIKN